MGAQEASAWLTRLDAPGPMRGLVSALASVASSPTPQRLPAIPKLLLSTSASTPAMRVGGCEGAVVLEAWLREKRDILQAVARMEGEE